MGSLKYRTMSEFMAGRPVQIGEIKVNRCYETCRGLQGEHFHLESENVDTIITNQSDAEVYPMVLSIVAQMPEELVAVLAANVLCYDSDGKEV